MKKYFKYTITCHDGRIVDNPLKLSEVSIISRMAQENKSILVEVREMDTKTYKLTFG